MAEYINDRLIEEVASQMGIKTEQVKATLSLLEEGGTIPFIARYRKEITGSLDEDQIREISKEYEYGVSLNKRKEDIIRLIDEKGMLTDELKQEILDAQKLITLEDIYRPYKEKKKTKATEAIKNGLKPLADWILSYPTEGDVIKVAKEYLNETVLTEEDALMGAKYIIAEQVSDNKEYRTYIREWILSNGFITGTKKKNAVDELLTYKDYYEYKGQISKEKSYRILALNRAEKEKVVSVSVEAERDVLVSYIKSKANPNKASITSCLIDEAIEDSYDRLIFPSIEREIRSILSSDAEDNAIKLFGDNLEHLLLQAPLKGKTVLSIDPAFRTGCKVAVLDKTGKVLGKGLIEQNQRYPEEEVPQKRIDEAKKLIRLAVKKYDVDIIAIGNGTASRETEKFVADTIKEFNLPAKYVIVSEAGASVYSASAIAQEEFPNFHIEERSAVSIGRRIQDPLAELVKIDPKSIGVGQYQHDVSEAKLSDTLNFVVQKAVNEVGVDINTASKSLLQYVSGLNKGTAQSIVDYRDQHGSFKDREQIKSVPKIGEKAFVQSVGFLRIPDSTNPLDKTSIHPESYGVADKILKYLGFTSNDLGSAELIRKINSLNPEVVSEELKINLITVQDIFSAFIAPTRDPRDDFPQPILRTDLLNLEDMKPGMKLQGTVRNITDFGAFIDVGIHDPGLVHISRMSNKKISHPSEVLSVGDIIDVFVEDIDIDRHRLGLTMLDPANPKEIVKNNLPKNKEKEKRVFIDKKKEKPTKPLDDLSYLDKLELDAKDKEIAGKIISSIGYLSDYVGTSELNEKLSGLNAAFLSLSLNIKEVDIDRVLSILLSHKRNPKDALPEVDFSTGNFSLFNLKSGQKLEGKVKNVVDYGCFVEVAPQIKGLVHISRMSNKRIDNPRDIVKEGDIITVWVKDVDTISGKLSLSMVDPSKRNRK